MFVDLVPKNRAHLISNLIRQIVAAIIHGQNNTLNVQIRIEPPAHHINRAKKLTQPLKSEKPHCRGTRRDWAAVMALKVRADREGGQSIKI